MKNTALQISTKNGINFRDPEEGFRRSKSTRTDISFRDLSSSQQRTVDVLHNSEQPASVFSILDTGSKTIPVVADTLFDLLVMKMNTVLQKRQKIESRGSRFELCDFCIKIGSVTVPGAGQNFKGVLLEIEYRACVIPNYCWEFMKEFIQGFLGTNTLNVPPQYLQTRMNDVYQPIDTIQQYLEHFNMFRKSTGIMSYN
ncbi:hypothetical protein PGB90_004383 [Kerria lacca]